MFESTDEAGLLDAMRGAQRRERVAIAERLLAAGRLCQRRARQDGAGNREQWCVDNWESVAAEVGAELGISRGRAASQMHYGLELLERLPKLGALFAAGDIDFRVVATAVFRTGLISDPGTLAAVDDRLARNASRWNTLSRNKIIEIVDWFVREVDPDAVRSARGADDATSRSARPGMGAQPYPGGVTFRPGPGWAGGVLGFGARPRRGGVRQATRPTGRHGVRRRPTNAAAAPCRRALRPGRRCLRDRVRLRLGELPRP